MTITCHTIKLVQKKSRRSLRHNITLTRAYQLKNGTVHPSHTLSVDTSLWSVFMCMSLSALILKVFRHSLQTKMCLSVMCLFSSLFVLNPSTHSLHGKYAVRLASASAFSFFRSSHSNLSSPHLWACISCSLGWSPPCFSLMCSSKSSAV